MKVWVTSDIHIDFAKNLTWFEALSDLDYTEDIMIIAGDITHNLDKMQRLFRLLQSKFFKILFVPGNHDLWLLQSSAKDSLQKLAQIITLTQDEGIQTTPFTIDNLTIVPLFSWYDFSFGLPSKNLKTSWRDFEACQWPMDLTKLTRLFLKMNVAHLQLQNQHLISFSHFLPFSSLIPSFVPQKVKQLLPVFGSQKLGEQLQQLKPDMHIYGHSHLNRKVTENGTTFLNNAFGYPYEERICGKQLLCVYENGGWV